MKMAQKKINLVLDEDVYKNYQAFCKQNGILLSESIENFMNEEMNNE